MPDSSPLSASVFPIISLTARSRAFGSKGFISSDSDDVEKFGYCSEQNFLTKKSIFSSSSSATEIFTIYNDLRSILDDASLAVTGSTLVWCYWLHLATMTTDIANPDGTSNSVKHWAVDYSIKAEAA